MTTRDEAIAFQPFIEEQPPRSRQICSIKCQCLSRSQQRKAIMACNSTTLWHRWALLKNMMEMTWNDEKRWEQGVFELCCSSPLLCVFGIVSGKLSPLNHTKSLKHIKIRATHSIINVKQWLIELNQQNNNNTSYKWINTRGFCKNPRKNLKGRPTRRSFHRIFRYVEIYQTWGPVIVHPS